MFKKIVVGLLAFVLSLILIGLCLPSDFRVERSISIEAPSEVVHRYVADLRTWSEWSAWNTTADPSLVYEYDGHTQGVGATMRWNGESLGNGKLKITESDPSSGIRYDLELQGGTFAARGQIRYGAEEQGTHVTWSDEGDLGWNPVYHWFGLMMDGMLGPEFEHGLAGLRAKAEAAHIEAQLEPAARPADETGSMGDDDSAEGDSPSRSLESGDDDSAGGVPTP